MKVILKLKMWDITGDYYLGYNGNNPCIVDNKLLATQFNLCGDAWRTLAKFHGVGNVENAALIEV